MRWIANGHSVFGNGQSFDRRVLGNSYKLAHLIGLSEVALRCWPGFAERLDRAGQIGDDFTDGNQLAALTLRGDRHSCLSSWQAVVFHGFLPTLSSRCSYTVFGRLLSLATPTPSPLDGRVS